MTSKKILLCAGLLLFIASAVMAKDAPSKKNQTAIEIEGALEVGLKEEWVNGELQADKLEYLYWLKTDSGKKYRLYFTDPPPGQWGVGVRLTVKGTRYDDVIFIKSYRSRGVDPELLPPRLKKIAIILFQFQDEAIQSLTQAPVRDATFHDLDGVKAYFAETSLGRVLLEGDVFGVYAVPFNSNDYGRKPTSDFELAATTSAQADGFVEAHYDHVVYYLSASFLTSVGGHVSAIGGKEIHLGGPHYSVEAVSHELGHSLGLYHAQALRCVDGTGEAVAISNQCQVTGEYNDPFDIMGQSIYRRHFSASYKDQLGWLDRSTGVQVVSSSGTYVLTPLEQPSRGLQLLKISRGSGSSLSTFYEVEYRQPLGFDGINRSPPAHVNIIPNGVFIRVVPQFWNNGIIHNSRLIDTAPCSEEVHAPCDGVDTGDAALAVGGVFQDTLNGIEIRTLSATPTQAHVQVTLGPVLHPRRYLRVVIVIPSLEQYARITSSPSGINCLPRGGVGVRCRQDYDDGSTVTLTVDQASLPNFTGWSGGGCQGNASSCTVTLNADTRVTATFRN